MTTVATRMSEIQALEGFSVVFVDSGKPVDPSTNGYPRFAFERRMKGGATVQEWKSGRFGPTYPGKDCQVLLADGIEAVGQTKLSTVRASYEDE